MQAIPCQYHKYAVLGKNIHNGSASPMDLLCHHRLEMKVHDSVEQPMHRQDPRHDHDELFGNVDFVGLMELGMGRVEMVFL